jgi:hypothetical protein
VHLVGAPGGVLFALDESFVEHSRLGTHLLVAVSQRGDVLLDDPASSALTSPQPMVPLR